MQRLIESNEIIMIEAAVIEQLRRCEDVKLDESLVHAPLIYDIHGRNALSEIYKKYIHVASDSGIPLLLCTPTWRTNKERVFASSIDSEVNGHAVNYMKELVASSSPRVPILIGGLIGCKNDCYLPQQALSRDEARKFHRWQIEKLTSGGADFLIAVTLPSLNEAEGIALAMEIAGLPYIISFVVGKDGNVLDGNSLDHAIEAIDNITSRKPLGYFVNCSYQSFLNQKRQGSIVYERLIGIQANASSLDHSELEQATELKSEAVDEWGDLMLKLHSTYGLKILGGCCGTNAEHLEYIVGKHQLTK